MAGLIRKGMKAFKRGGAWGNLRKYVRRKFPVKLIRNKNVNSWAVQDMVYRKLHREFKPVIDEGVQVNGPQEMSDKVWICWFQGLDQAPELVKACVESVRRNLPDREIIIITNENIHDYVQFPDYIEKKWKAGIISFAHLSDILRVELLCRYGGIWIDSTVLCTDGEFASYIKELPLFNYVRADLTRKDQHPTLGPSWVISAHSNHPILLLTCKLLYAYWSKYNHLEDYFLFHLFFAMAARRYIKDWEAIPAFDNHPANMMQFEIQNEYSPERWNQLLRMSDFHKLNHRKAFAEGNTIYNHILKMYLP